MHTGTSKLIRTVGLASFLFCCGCVGLGRTTFLNADRPPARPTPSTFTEAVAELRIPPDQVPADPVPVDPPAPARRGSSPTEIPLVPVPPPPLKGDRPNPPMPPAQPLANQPAALPQMLTPQQLFLQAGASFARYDSYIARLTRREPSRGKAENEVLAFTFRKAPWSVRFKWLAGDGVGREVLFVKGQYENKIHTLLAAGDIPLVPAGKRIAMSMDSVLVKAASRHPITHAGIGAMLDRFAEVLAATAQGNVRLGKLTALGLQQRDDYEGPLYMVEHTLPPGAEPDAPKGGRRLYGFSPDNQLPVLAVLQDQRGQEIEYYRFDRLMLGVKLDDADFDPEQMGTRADPSGENAARR